MDDSEYDRRLERYKVLVSQEHYDGMHRFWTVGWFLVAQTVLLGSLLQSALRDGIQKPHPIMFWASVAGFVLCIPWASTLSRLSAYYRFRIAQATAVERELDGWDCFGGKAADFARSDCVEVNNHHHRIRYIPSVLRERRSVWFMIGIFAAMYIYLASMSWPWR